MEMAWYCGSYQPILGPFVALTEGQVDGRFAELWAAGDGGVLLVHVLLHDLSFSLEELNWTDL